MRAAALDKIHQQKGKIVKHVTRGHDRIELERIKRQWRTVYQRDIAEMQVAMAASDESLRAARQQQRASLRERVIAGGRQRRGGVLGK